MAATQLFIKAFACALCALSSKWLLVVGELVLYLLYKLARRDFLYWPPIYGPFGVIVSIVTIVLVKIVVDFTGVHQFRHPQEVGGAYWMLNLAATPISCFYFASRYLNSIEISEGDVEVREPAKLTSEQVYSLIDGLCAFQLFSFLIFSGV